MSDLARDACLDTTGRRWLVKFARKSMWRVAHWYELDDLINDGLMCWQIVVRRYPQVHERRHLMALFQRIYINHIHQLANKRTAQLPESPDPLPDIDRSCPETELLQLISDTPVAVRACLRRIMERPDLLDRPRRHHSNGKHMTTNEFLCSLIGVSPKDFDLHNGLKEALKL